MDKTEFITEHNKFIDSIDLSKNSIEIAKSFNKNQWFLFIAGRTLKFGRSFKDSVINANCHLENYPKNKDKLIKLFCFKENDLMGGF